MAMSVNIGDPESSSKAKPLRNFWGKGTTAPRVKGFERMRETRREGEAVTRHRIIEPTARGRFFVLYRTI